LRKTNDESGQLAIVLNDFVPDVFLCIGDLWDFLVVKDVLSQFKDKHELKTILWVTVDGEYLWDSWGDTVRAFDSVISFSDYGAKELKKLSKGTHVDVVYPGIDETIFNAFPRDHEWGTDNIIDVKNTFTVLSVAQNTSRKNLPATIDAFGEFCKNKKDVLLFMVTDPRDSLGYDLWTIVKKAGIGNRCVIAKDAGARGAIDDMKMNLLYNMSTVLLNTAIGEGFGLPLLEAQACNCIPMATNYASATEVIGDRGILVDPVAMVYGEYGIKRAVIDEKCIVENLNRLYEAWKAKSSLITEYQDKGAEFSKKHTWDKTAAEISNIIQRTTSKKRVWVKEKIRVEDMNLLEVVPSWGKNCGIAEYSKELSEAIEKTGDIVNIFPGQNLMEIIERAKEKKYNVVVFQHEYSFFQDRFALEKALDQLREAKIKSVIEMHTFSPIRHYNDMLMSKADEIIVHCDSYKEKMVGAGEADHVSVIKLGCKEPFLADNTAIKKNLGLEGKHPIVGSFGFMRDQKGYHDIARAVQEMVNDYPDVAFLLVAPKHEYGSTTYEEQFYKFIEDLGIAERTVIVREYMDEEKLLATLSCADVFILNYKESRAGGGNSAAIKTLMRVQRPIIVTDTFYFGDLENEVCKIKDLNKYTMMKQITEFISKPELAKQYIDKANEFLSEHSWEKNAKRHLNVYVS
jgi:glycosyltransferase involved in cell wall biosynthesis